MSLLLDLNSLDILWVWHVYLLITWESSVLQCLSITLLPTCMWPSRSREQFDIESVLDLEHRYQSRESVCKQRIHTTLSLVFQKKTIKSYKQQIYLPITTEYITDELYIGKDNIIADYQSQPACSVTTDLCDLPTWKEICGSGSRVVYGASNTRSSDELEQKILHSVYRQEDSKLYSKTSLVHYPSPIHMIIYAQLHQNMYSFTLIEHQNGLEPHLYKTPLPSPWQ